MTKWVKPSGVIVELNDLDATIDAAIALGWELESEKPSEKTEEPPKKRGRPKKVEE